MIPFNIYLEFFHLDRVSIDEIATLADKCFALFQNVVTRYDIQVSKSSYWYYPDDESEQA